MYNPKRGGKSIGGKKSFGGGFKGGSKFGGGQKPWERGSDGRDGARPFLHKATCAECNQSCEVPFKPNGSRPVLCSNCFKRDGGSSPQRFGGSDSRRPSYDERRSFKPSLERSEGSFQPAPNNQFAEQLKMVNAKLDAILDTLTTIVEANADMDEDEDENGDEDHEEVIVEAPKKTTKKKAAAAPKASRRTDGLQDLS